VKDLMSNLKLAVYQHLSLEAIKYFPEMIHDHDAITDQWLHSIAYNQIPFGKGKGVTLNKLLLSLEKSKIISVGMDLSKLRPKSVLTCSKSPVFTFIDLFAGIGGMRIGFQAEDGLTVFSSEFEKNAQETYLLNHGEKPFGDITKIDPFDIPAHDVLLAGFPCQPFSHAGLKKGIRDTRGTLFHNIAEILKVKKPKVALLENVKGLISHDEGYTLQTILRTLTAIGYQCNISQKIIDGDSLKALQAEAKRMVLKSIDFGIPQNRQRIYLVLWKKGLAKNFSYPSPLKIQVKVGDILEKNPAAKYTISDRLWDGHKRRKAFNMTNGKGFGYGLVSSDSPYTNTISARYYKDGSEILIEQEGKNPRKLTPKEAALLQGFPPKFKLNPSDAQAYKQFGNSVTVPVIRALASEIKKQLLKG
jgi:DNA (cytosine-5)-methyltransferase 1